MDLKFIGGITDIGKDKLDSASPESLTLGRVEIGSASLSVANFSNAINSLQGNKEIEFNAEDVIYTPFGNSRVVISINVEISGSLSIGNVLFYLSDGTPFAWGAFSRTIKKTANGPDTGGDWFTISLSLIHEDIFTLFDFTNQETTQFRLPIALNEEEAANQVANTRESIIADAVTTNFNIPGYMFCKDTHFINPFFLRISEGFDAVSGGVVGDAYDRSI